MSDVVEGPELSVPETTIPEEFLAAVERYGDRTAVRVPREGDGRTEEHTWFDLRERVEDVAHGLLSLGIEPGDRVAIQSPTRLEWALADLAILSVGAVTATVYATLTPEEGAYLVEDSGSRVMFVSDQEQFDKVHEARDELDDVEQIVTFETVDAGELAKRTRTLDDLAEAGRRHAEKDAQVLDQRREELEATEPSSIVYTSGTTGRPKGCVLSHRNFLAAGQSVAQILPVGEDDVGLAFLPLAHVYQRLTLLFNMRAGSSVVFTTPDRLADDLVAFQPTMLASVPRIYERMHQAVVERVETEAGAAQKAIFEAASRTAREHGKASSAGGTPGPWLSLKHSLFDRLVYEDLREKLGASNLRHVITGAAAIRPDLLYWLRGVGIPILEGYGLTETSAPSNLNRPDSFKPGTVGPPIPGVKQKIRPLDDQDYDGSEEADGPVGEVLMKGPNIFERYFQLPEETEDAFTDDGWFKSGDIGYFDEDGYLRIVDRLKQIEVLETGRNVAPVPIEEELKNSDWIAEAMAVGSDRKYMTALIQPNYERILATLDEEGITYGDEDVGRTETPSGTEITSLSPELMEHEAIQAPIREAVEEANEAFAHYEQVGGFHLLPRALSIEEDELTPTLKKKRRNIRSGWSHLIDEMYEEP